MLKNLTTITTVKCWYWTAFDSNPLWFQSSAEDWTSFFSPPGLPRPSARQGPSRGPAVTSQPISWKPLTSQTRGPRALWPHRWLGPTAVDLRLPRGERSFRSPVLASPRESLRAGVSSPVLGRKGHGGRAQAGATRRGDPHPESDFLAGRGSRRLREPVQCLLTAYPWSP